MRRTVGILVVLLVAAGAPGARAASSQGGAFDLPEYGARVWGMGGTAVALVDDESALDWNPARLSLVSRTIGASYVNLVQGTTIGESQIVFVTPFGHDPAHRHGVAQHAAGIMFTNLSANVLGGERYSENHLRVAYAISPQPLFSIAMAGQLFFSRSGVSGFDAWGTGVDFAGRLSLSRNWDIGVVLRNAFSRYTYSDSQVFEEERRLVLGIATHRYRHVTLSADAVHSYGTWSQTMIGAESEYLFSVLAVRAGITFHHLEESRATAAFGASVRAFGERVTLHYGANLDNRDALGTTHRISLGVRL